MVLIRLLQWTHAHSFTVMARLVCQNTCPFAAYIRPTAELEPSLEVIQQSRSIIARWLIAYRWPIVLSSGYHGPND
jgi:hypothetical protein